MKKIFTFMLLAAGLLVSVPSWAQGVTGEEKTFKELGMPLVPPDLNGGHFGTICIPQRIVATQGVVIYDVLCVDKFYNNGNNDGNSDTTKVARLVIDVHTVCNGWTQYDPKTGSWDEPFCPGAQGTAYGYEGSDNPCEKKVYVDWVSWPNEDYPQIDYRMKAGGAYFYAVCNDGADSLKDRKIWVDTEDVATAPVCVNGFYGTLAKTTINFPITVLTQDVNSKIQYLEQVTQVTLPANRGYFKGNFNCVPWRWNTFSAAEPHPFVETDDNQNIIHYPCSDAPKVQRRVSPNAIAFNVGRDVATGLYQIDFEHPIYLGKETNKRIENGQLIIEAADGTKYNAFGQRVK